MKAFEIDDIMTCTNDSAERCYLALDELTNDFRDTYDEEMKCKLAVEYKRYRILLNIAFLACAEIFGNIERYESLVEAYKATQDKQTTYKEQIAALLEKLDESDPADAQKLRKMYAEIHKIFVTA